MLILLPDFIGHPSCFRGLLARLGPDPAGAAATFGHPPPHR
ncbi:hypothetical protein ACLBVZ_29450, partial [Pseudomonas aeruginosa]